MKNGEKLYAYTNIPKGNPLEKPLSKQEIEEKFWKNVAFSKTISKENAGKILEMLNHIENIKDANELVALLHKD